VIAQVAGALDAAHLRGLVHRDVKPANVLVAAEEPEHAYLTDFGVARRVGVRARVTRAGQWVGTLEYLAPEQIRGEAPAAAGDVYALTGLIYHCLTGEVPFPRDGDAALIWAHMSVAPPAATRVRPDLPQALDSVIARGMAKDPAERFASAGELASACVGALGLAHEEPLSRAPMRADRRSAPLPDQLAPTVVPD
jgi:serine/threonine-protein kinase